MTTATGRDYADLYLQIEALRDFQDQINAHLIDMDAPIEALRASAEVRRQIGTVQAIMFDEMVSSSPIIATGELEEAPCIP